MESIRPIKDFIKAQEATGMLDSNGLRDLLPHLQAYCTHYNSIAHIYSGEAAAVKNGIVHLQKMKLGHGTLIDNLQDIRLFAEGIANQAMTLGDQLVKLSEEYAQASNNIAAAPIRVATAHLLTIIEKTRKLVAEIVSEEQAARLARNDFDSAYERLDNAPQAQTRISHEFDRTLASTVERVASRLKKFKSECEADVLLVEGPLKNFTNRFVAALELVAKINHELNTRVPQAGPVMQALAALKSELL